MREGPEWIFLHSKYFWTIVYYMVACDFRGLDLMAQKVCINLSELSGSFWTLWLWSTQSGLSNKSITPPLAQLLTVPSCTRAASQLHAAVLPFTHLHSSPSLSSTPGQLTPQGGVNLLLSARRARISQEVREQQFLSMKLSFSLVPWYQSAHTSCTWSMYPWPMYPWSMYPQVHLFMEEWPGRKDRTAKVTKGQIGDYIVLRRSFMSKKSRGARGGRYVDFFLHEKE